MFPAIPMDVLRDDGFRIVVGELIAAAGLVAMLLQVSRWRSTDRSTLFFGLASLLYGFRLIAEMTTLQQAFPAFPWRGAEAVITLLIGYPFVLFLGDTLARKYPWYTRAVLVLVTMVAVIGFVTMALGWPMHRIYVLNSVVTLVTLAGWGYVGIFPKVPITREVNTLRSGLAVMGLTALYQNLWFFHSVYPARWLEPLGMVFMLGTFLYVSAARTLHTERSLLALNNELDIARKIQFQLLPALDSDLASLEIHARYVPAGSVAGDFYEILRDGRGLGVLIADVSGHGVPAALSASMLKVALRAQEASIAHPAEVLRGLNRILCGILRGQFITAAYVYIDPERRELRYAGAGHPPLLLWRAAAGAVEPLEENGLFLGPFPWAQYQQKNVRFEPGDRCLLYTDGVLEAANARQEEYGIERLSALLARKSALTADALCGELEREVAAWSGGTPESQGDDITFVAIGFRSEGVSAAR